MDKNLITLEIAFETEKTLKILDMMQNEEGIKEIFKGRNDRLLTMTMKLLNLLI